MAFLYKNNQFGHLHKSTFTPLSTLVSEGDEPVYVYDLQDILKRVDLFLSGFGDGLSIHYAMKANGHPEILSALAKKNIGADTVSIGEVDRAIENGFKPENVVFSGVGKTVREIKKAVELELKQINVESPEELVRIAKIAKELGKKANVAFRMNPDVDPDTHPYIKTGFRDNKFGMDDSFIPELERILKDNSDSLNLMGLTIHIGSQIRQVNEFVEAVKKTRPAWDYFKSLGYKLKTFDIGGGLGLSYDESDYDKDYRSITNYCETLKQAVAPFEAEQILIEPGRVLTARAGVLLTEIQYIKQSPYKNFAIVNTGMHHLLRPSLYKAHHRILPLVKELGKGKLTYDIVGPICESSDVLGYDRNIEELKQGQWLAVLDTGAYGYSMANFYNCHELPKEVVL